MAITESNKAIVNESAEVQVTNNPWERGLERAWRHPKLPTFLMALPVIGLIYPGFSTLILIFSLLSGFLLSRTPIHMPLKRPMSSGDRVDAGSIQAGTENKKTEAKAITCLGYDPESGYQLWEDSDNERRHVLILATTGSGKTFGLRFHLLMTMIQTTGVIAIDGKGDIALPLDSTTLFRRFLRDEDVRILNFQQGSRNVYEETIVPRTHTFNPLSTGSSSYISEVLKSLISSDDPKAGKGDMWQKRAEGMCDLLSSISTYKRDHGDFKVRPGSIADLMELRELMKVYVDKDIPEHFKSNLKTYFTTLPGGIVDKADAYANGEEFVEKTLEQHSYVTMQLQPALLVLSQIYGYIFDVDIPDIHPKDIIVNNRILMGLLPAMEQSESTLRNTGKIILASLKGMIAAELGAKYQGNVRDLLNARAVNDPAPFKNFFDECGYYAAIPGIEILPAQGRGLGFAFYFIGQTYLDLEKGGKETAGIIWGNVLNKQIGKTTEETTVEKYSKEADKATVLVRESIDIRDGAFGTERIKGARLSYTQRDRLTMKDVTKLREGQYFHLTNGMLLQVRSGDPIIPNGIKETRYTQFLPMGNIPKSLRTKLRRDYGILSRRFEENVSGAKPRQIKADHIPALSNLIHRYASLIVQNETTYSGRLKLWQQAIYEDIRKDRKESEDNAAEAINDILGISTKSNSAERGAAKHNESITQQSQTNDFDALAVDENDWTSIAAKVAAAPPNYTNAEEDEESSSGISSDTNSEINIDTTLDSSQTESMSSNERLNHVDEDDWQGERIDPLEADKEFLRYQLEEGMIDDDEYETQMMQLDEDYQRIVDNEDDDGVDVELERSLTQFTRRRSVDDVKIDGRSEDNEPYRKSTIDGLKAAGNKKVAEQILNSVSQSFNIDI